MADDIGCPWCRSNAYYKYGRTANGKQRYLCLVCNRQFIAVSSRHRTRNRPACPDCGSPMHVYQRNTRVIRYRCAKYPECRTYLKKTVATV